MIVAQFILLAIIAAASSKPVAKKNGLAVTPRRAPIRPNKLAVTRTKTPTKRVNKPVANKLPATKKPIVPANIKNRPARKPAVNRTIPAKKHAVTRITQSKKTAGNRATAVKRTTSAKRTPVVKRTIPVQKIVSSKKPVPTKKLTTIAPVKKPAPIKRITPTKVANQKERAPPKPAGQVARTKSHLEAAMAYMKAQGPIENSGNRKIEDLLASPSEAQTAEPFDPHKFIQARSQKIKEKNQKAQNSAAHSYSVPFWIMITIIIATLV